LEHILARRRLSRFRPSVHGRGPYLAVALKTPIVAF
jgi:hypothetical protein